MNGLDDAGMTRRRLLDLRHAKSSRDGAAIADHDPALAPRRGQRPA
jgi:hypothetical protein